MAFFGIISTRVINFLSLYRYNIILIIYGFLPVLWFKDKYLVRSEEKEYLNYTYLYEKYLFSWTSHLNNGYPSTQYDHLLFFPMGVLYKITSSLEIPNYITQRVVLVFISYLTIYSIYKLTYHFTQDKVVCFISVFFYTLSFYSLTTPFYSAKMYQLFMMPLCFYLFLKYLEEKKYTYLAWNFFIVFFFQGIWANLPQAIATYSVYLMALIYYYATQPTFSKITKDIKYILVFLTTVIPTLYYVFITYYFSSYQYFEVFQKKLTFQALNSMLSNIYQFRGHLLERQGWQGVEYNAWVSFYDRPLIIIISYFLFGFIFFGLYLKRGGKQYLLWLLFLLFFIFLTKGSQQPLGFIYSLLYHHIPFFFIFRDPWAKFIPLVLFCATVLLSFTLKAITNKKKIIYIIVLLLILIRGYPFFTRDVFDHRNIGWKIIDIRIPHYWIEAQEWSKKHKDENVLIIPWLTSDQWYFYKYKWYTQDAGNFVGWLYHTFLYCNSIDLTGENYLSNKYLFAEDWDNKFLPLWNVKYVLVQKDVDLNGYAGNTLIDFNKLGTALIKEPDKIFGKLELYKVSDPYYLPKIYFSQ